ncbi:hypothetical protein [Saccharopolyspora hattusasensis]|uniref:hypothetical protein n=1 Tax=Saccharopolyspora hattusasensis TaxID=1128679 RepID=UPI003D98EECB
MLQLESERLERLERLGNLAGIAEVAELADRMANVHHAPSRARPTSARRHSPAG